MRGGLMMAKIWLGLAALAVELVLLAWFVVGYVWDAGGAGW
jgi:hypothetical protein